MSTDPIFCPQTRRGLSAIRAGGQWVRTVSSITRSNGTITYMATGDADGSVRIYGPINANCSTSIPCVWAPPPGVSDTLVWYDPASTLERHFIDGSKWVYTLNPPVPVLIYRIDRFGTQQNTSIRTARLLTASAIHSNTWTILKYNSSNQLDSIVEPGANYHIPRVRVRDHCAGE